MFACVATRSTCGEATNVGARARFLLHMVSGTAAKQAKQRVVLTKGRSVTFVAGTLTVRRCLFEKLVPSKVLTTGLQLANAAAF